jgi:hypothetical protein
LHSAVSPARHLTRASFAPNIAAERQCVVIVDGVGGMAGLVATCPVTGEDVFPDIRSTLASGAGVMLCPSCGKEHRWNPMSTRLTGLADDADEALSGGEDAPRVIK